jgi:hypothetical protein
MSSPPWCGRLLVCQKPCRLATRMSSSRLFLDSHLPGFANFLASRACGRTMECGERHVPVMIRGRRHSTWRTWRRRTITGVALIAYLATAVGYPLPAASAGRKDFSQPFPCQGHVCGCQSAEECWSACCCLTPEERWAWARAHGVQPPEYAEKPATTPGWRTVRLRDQAEARNHSCGSCCDRDHPSRGSCCSKSAAHVTRPTCCSRSKPEDDSQSGSTALARHSGGWVPGVSALRCKGLSLLWVDGGVVVPAVGCASRIYVTPPEQAATENDQPVRLGQAPPAPPPKPLSA